MTEATKKSLKEPLTLDNASMGVRRTWAKRILDGKAAAIPVFVGGAWTLNIQRGNKRLLRLPVD